MCVSRGVKGFPLFYTSGVELRLEWRKRRRTNNRQLLYDLPTLSFSVNCVVYEWPHS